MLALDYIRCHSWVASWMTLILAIVLTWELLR